MNNKMENTQIWFDLFSFWYEIKLIGQIKEKSFLSSDNG